MRSVARACCLALAALATAAAGVRAQDNYEIQVYGAPTVEPHSTMFELHSNFTFDGRKSVLDGMYPTEHAEHETIEITQGINDWAEVGFYIFTSARNGQGVQWVGDHIRPRVRVPDSWHWPVGVSLSTEFGYQRTQFSEDSWNWEIRPIIDQTIGPWYWAINPAFERTWKGPGVTEGVGFAPSAKVAYTITPKVAGGFEYYGSYGSVQRLRADARPAAPVLRRLRSQRESGVGDQLRPRRGHHAGHRPPDRQADSGTACVLGEPEGRAVARFPSVRSDIGRRR